MVSEYTPPRRLSIVGIALGCFIAGAIATVGTMVDWGPPAAPPFVVEDVRSGFVDRDGRQLWRVEIVVDVARKCEILKVDRSFAAASGGPIWRQVPVASYFDSLGMRLGSAPYTIDLARGRHLVWHEYEITLKTTGRLIIETFATGCERGPNGRQWSGPLEPITEAFDWRGHGG